MDSYKILKIKASEFPEQYRNMLYSKFLRSLKFGNEYFRLIDQDSYYKMYHAYIESLLARPQSSIKLAVLTDEPDVVLGWALLEPKVVHFCYVNRDNRRIGICTSLLSEPFDTFTHITNSWMNVWTKKYKSARFDPFK